MPKYVIEYKEVEGTLEYSNSIPVEFEVVHDNPEVIKIVTDYLTKTTDYPIPESQQFDDYRIDIAKPTEDIPYFELALCTIKADTGINFYWEREVK